MRRLVFLAALGPALGAACSSTQPPAVTGAPDADSRPPTPAEWDRAVTRTDEATAVKDRAGCKFGRGAMPAETLGREIPVDKDMPIDTIVLLMQENRSFDHYYGHLGRYANRSDIESAPENATNPQKTGPSPGAQVPWKRGEHLCLADVNHSWKGSHLQYDDGKMDGFVETNHESDTDPLLNGARAMWWYDEKEIPFYYQLATAFGIADHYHCSLLGPTWPNRMFFYGGTSYGMTFNSFPNLNELQFSDGKDAVILDLLERRHVDWKLYTAGGPPGIQLAIGPTLPTRWGRSVTPGNMQAFFDDAAAGKLPAFVLLDGNYLNEGKGGSGNDEHPASNPQVGQKLVYDIVSALTKSPQWPRLAFFLNYDEHGGFYDHVPPPAACEPDKIAPIFSKPGSDTTGAKFDRLGFRVPLLVVSPYVKKGFVSHTVYDHASVLRFVEAKFKLPALSARDANASVPIDFFDFASPPNLVPPRFDEPKIDAAELEYCKKNFGE
jgi:phospholipase C